MPDIITLQEGVVTKLEVKIAGKPKPDVKWSKDNEEIKPSDEYQIENFDDGTSILVINNVYPDDAGFITVEAISPVGEAFSTTELTFQGIFNMHFKNGRRCALLWFKIFIYFSGITYIALYMYITKKINIFLKYVSASFPPTPFLYSLLNTRIYNFFTQITFVEF